MAGPLAGHRIIELAGIGPGPFAAMMLSDMGAEVLRVLDRADAVRDGADAPSWDVNARGRRSVAVDLKHPAGREVVLRLVAQADARGRWRRATGAGAPLQPHGAGDRRSAPGAGRAHRRGPVGLGVHSGRDRRLARRRSRALTTPPSCK